MSVKAGSGERGREIERVLDTSELRDALQGTLVPQPLYNSPLSPQRESAIIGGIMIRLGTFHCRASRILSTCPVARSPGYALLFPRASSSLSFFLSIYRAEDHSAGVTTH